MPALYLPDLSVSQNCLKDSHLVASVLDRCSITPEDMVLEIGPGRGIITAQLVRRCKKVISIEKDPALIAILRRKFNHQDNLVIRCGDFLTFRLPLQPYKVFSNIPFNITSAIVTRLTTAPHPPEDSYLVLQKEAAMMYLGKPRESLRSILLHPWFELEILFHFHCDDFTPRPGVETVMLRIARRNPPLINRGDRQDFRDFVVYGFTTWRSTLGELLKGIFTHRQLIQMSRTLNINLQATPTTLRLEQWLDLFEMYKHIAYPQAVRLVSGSELHLRRQQDKLQKIHRTRKR